MRFSRPASTLATAVPGLPAAVGLRPASGYSEPDRAAGLTLREQEVLALLATGATNQQIADLLTLSEGTVKSHVKHVLRKLPAANRSEAAYLYLRSAAARAQAG